MKKVEFVKPVLHISKFFKIADHLLRSDDLELMQLGRAMRNTYEAQMLEIEEKYEEHGRNPDKDIESYNYDDCKSGMCD